MTINLSMPATHQLKPRITVVGVGGAGGNAVNNMITSHLEGVEFVVANTDAQALAQSLSERRIQLGVDTTQGLGAGSRPDVGRAAAEEAIDEILENLEGSNMVFITAGLGGGTGTGGGPVVARAARENGILTVGVVTKPFQFEGAHRMRMAEEGLDELQKYVDTLIVIPNQNLFRVANEKTTFADAFKMADDVLYSGVRGVTDLMVMPGLINLDFADVRAVMAEMGKAVMGTGESSGERRAVDAAESAISNPLLDDVSMRGARGVLINITGGYDMTLFEVDEAANRIREEVDSEANIIFGSTFDEGLAGSMRVSVVATGIDVNGGAYERPAFAVAAPPPVAVIETAPVDVVEEEALAAESEIETTELAVAEEAAQEEPVAVDAGAAEAAAPEVATPAESEAAKVSEPVADEPVVASPPDGGFVPRPPITPGPTAPMADSPDPFAAAAISNGGLAAPRKEGRRAFSLFERMTGAGRARSAPLPREAAPETKREPVLETVGATVGATAAAAPAATGMTLPRVEEDQLDIPAFLRRQSN